MEVRKRMDPETVRALDNHLGALSDKEQDELRREGGRLQAQKSRKEADREKQREYLRHYRARLGLMNRLGLMEKE